MARAVAIYELTASNNEPDSENRIHSDDVAAEYGFKGGLVPGVTVYSYMIHPVVSQWGVDWLERGSASCLLVSPCYEGDSVTASAVGGASENELTLIVDRDNVALAKGSAMLPAAVEVPSAREYVAADLPDRGGRTPADRGALEARRNDPLGSIEYAFDADRASKYVESVKETSTLYTDERIAHPGFLLTNANTLFSKNVAVGPWIHVESEVQNYSVVRHGDEVSVRGWVRDLYEKRGNKFVVLDVGIVIDGERLATRIRHVAIYEIRRP